MNPTPSRIMETMASLTGGVMGWKLMMRAVGQWWPYHVIGDGDNSMYVDKVQI